MEYKKWECIVCGWIYDEEKGNPEEGIEPGTKWEDVPMIGCVQNVVLVKKILI